MKRTPREAQLAEATTSTPPSSHIDVIKRKKREVLVSRDSVANDDDDIVEFEPVVSRHNARQVALQIAYNIELTSKTLTEQWSQAQLVGEQRHLEFLKRLLIRTYELQVQLDEEIVKRVERWTIDRLALTDHLLLRLALCELLFMEETPPKVVLNEAIELAKEFSTTQSGRFINGILDAALSEHQPKVT
jgi:transcription antitermination protein NusB